MVGYCLPGVALSDQPLLWLCEAFHPDSRDLQALGRVPENGVFPLAFGVVFQRSASASGSQLFAAVRFVPQFGPAVLHAVATLRFAGPLPERAPLGRSCEAQEVGELAAFLASDAAAAITGQTIYVDAGAHIVA